MPYSDSLIPVLGEEISPLPGWLDKLQHIMLDSYLLCCGYLLQLSIKCNIIIKFWKYIFLYLVSYSLWCRGITTSFVVSTHLNVFEEQMTTTLILANCGMLAKWTKIFLSIARR